MTFICDLCTCAQVITCLLCDADACARCYTCTRARCPNAAVLPHPPKTPLQEWEYSLPGPFTSGGAVDTPRSAGSGFEEEIHWVGYTSLTISINGREQTFGPGRIGVVPGDYYEHRT